MKFRTLFCYCLSVLTLVSCADDNCIYVSSSKGNDRNSGKSIEHPVKTIKHALKRGKDIKLRDGDIFFESIEADNFTLSPYHDGDEKAYQTAGNAPMISSFRIIGTEASKELWEPGRFDRKDQWQADENGEIYRLDLSSDKLEGYKGDGDTWNIGVIYDPATDVFYGRKCMMTSQEKYDACTTYKTGSPYRYLMKDYDFYQTFRDYRYLYVLCRDKELLVGKELWLSSGVNAITGSDYSVTGIDFKGLGQHGCRGGSNITITNCSFDVIGGSILNYLDNWVRYGNGVEFWAEFASQNNFVTGCTFSRVFDTGTTIQGPMSKDSPCGNIHFSDNVFRNCRQDFETWIDSSDGTMPFNCSFTGNKGYDCGDNGFETEEFNNCHLLHYVNCEYPFTDLDISGNDFFGGKCLYYSSKKMDDEKIGVNYYHCAPGADVLHCPNGIVIVAPYPVMGKFRHPAGIDDKGELIWKDSDEMDEAVKETEALVNNICGGAGFKLVIESEVLAKAQTIKALQKKQRDGFFFWTDSHVQANKGNTPMYLKLASDPSRREKVVFGGDCMPAFVEEIESYWAIQKDMNQEIMAFTDLYYIKGNHDFTCKFQPDRPQGITYTQEKSAAMIASAMNGKVCRNEADPGCCHYYFDQPDSKIRYIVFDTTDSIISEKMGFGTVHSISEGQFDWIFRNAVLNAPQGYSLVILSHIPCNPSFGNDDMAQRFFDAVTAIAEHKDFPMAGKKYAFSTREDLDLLFVLSGHHHNDIQFFTDNVLSIVTSCDACYNDFIISPFVTNRNTNRHNSELCQAFDHVSIATDSKTVRMTRMGSGDDRVFHLERQCIKKGEELQLISSLKGDCKWSFYDGRDNHYVSGPNYTGWWVLSQKNLAIDQDGKIKGENGGEAIVVASRNGSREFFLVTIEES